MLPTLSVPVHLVHGKDGATNLGLGLFIAKEVVVAHGGDIKVMSSQENGTTFEVTLPRRPDGAVADAPVH